MGNTYTREFKIRAVRLSRKDDVTCKEVAEDLGMSEQSLYRWRKQYREHGDGAFSGRGNSAPGDDEEKAELQRENAKLRQERDILKKAMSIFADKG